jgi:parvulin-like peptidyl-prolyl isomerase
MLKILISLSFSLTMVFANTLSKNDLEKKLTVHSLAKKSDIGQSKIYKDRVQRAKYSILMNMYLQEKKDSIGVELKESQKYYKKNMRDYTNVHAYTIVRNDPKKLLEYVKILNATKKDSLEKKFKELAKKYSQHPRKSKGGDMGFVGYNSIVQPFGEEAFKLKKNTFTKKPIKTVLGYHLIYVSEIKIVGFEKLKNKIENILINQRYKKRFMGL